MPITVNSNPSATAASFYLTRNNRALQRRVSIAYQAVAELFTLMMTREDLLYQ